MGVFRVSVEIAALAGDRFQPLVALVDRGATYSFVPRTVLQQLGVAPEEEWPFVLADGREVHYPVAAVRVRLRGRTRHTLVVFGDAESEPLLGAYTLEGFGLAADPVNRRLVPVPGMLKPGLLG